MRSGDSERTLELLRRRRSSSRWDEAFSLLRAEAALRLGDRSQLPPHDEEHLLFLLERTDAAEIARWGQKEAERRLLVDASLIYLEDGHMQEALMIARDQIEDVEHDRFYATVAYDAGDFEQAEQRLKRYIAAHGGNTEIRLLLADVQLLSGGLEEAQQNYREVLSDHVSDLQAVALLNYAWILGRKGRSESAMALLQHGNRQFGSDVRIGLELAKAYVGISGSDSSEGSSQAVETLRRLTGRHPENLALAFLLFRLDTDRPDPRSYQSWLWRAFTADPTDERLCRYLMWYLLGLGDISGVRLALRTFEGAGGDRKHPGILHVRGLAEALQGNDEAALGHLNESLSIAEDLRVLYNRAVIHLNLNNLRAAEQDLWRAIDLLGMRERESRLEATIRSRIGEIQFRKGNRRAAIRELRYALEFDPTHPYALLLLEEYDERR
jgi:tetratricopeptide (TPR) repeat protein